MKVYLAGPMTGYVNFNFDAFECGMQLLEAQGYEVISPHKDVIDTSCPWEFYMRRALKLLLDCDGIALLPGWSNSRGASLEQAIASSLGMPRINIDCSEETSLRLFGKRHDQSPES